MVLGIKEGLVECATVCVKSVVILILATTASHVFSLWLFHAINFNMHVFRTDKKYLSICLFSFIILLIDVQPMIKLETIYKTLL